MTELLAMARARPGQLAFGSAGIGSSLHMAGELLKMRTGIDITHVPYGGAAPAVTDLLAGRIQILMADVPALIGQVRAGALPALAVTAPERLGILPNVPTAVEAGVPGMVSETWYGVLGPANIPADRVATLHAALRAALEDPATRDALINQGGRVVGSTPADFATFMRATHASWGEVVRATGVRLE
jgi:tripartite-type tricarboxylate transporter receptor subunit TctC